MFYLSFVTIIPSALRRGNAFFDASVFVSRTLWIYYKIYIYMSNGLFANNLRLLLTITEGDSVVEGLRFFVGSVSIDVIVVRAVSRV